MTQQRPPVVHSSESRSLLLFRPSELLRMFFLLFFLLSFLKCIFGLLFVPIELQTVVIRKCVSKTCISDPGRSGAILSAFLREPPGQVRFTLFPSFYFTPVNEKYML